MDEIFESFERVHERTDGCTFELFLRIDVPKVLEALEDLHHWLINVLRSYDEEHGDVGDLKVPLFGHEA